MALSPAFAKHPDHRVDVEARSGRVRVEFAGETIADSTRCLSVRESHHSEVVYFPRDDVRMQCVERSEYSTFCPFKGTATHWTLRVGDRVAENAIWSYEEPYDQVAELRECMAFYVDRVDALREG
jgi:uncharacterized protein (DUF427 family)